MKGSKKKRSSKMEPAKPDKTFVLKGNHSFESIVKKTLSRDASSGELKSKG